MSSGCGDVLSLEDMKTAKKHQTFEAEVITGRAGGVSSGAEIDFATNQVTGQVQKTMPAILRDIGFSPASFDFTTGGTLTVADRDAVVYNPADNNWYSWTGTLPHVVAPGTDPAAVGSGYTPRPDTILRSDLAASTGYELVHGARPIYRIIDDTAWDADKRLAIVNTLAAAEVTGGYVQIPSGAHTIVTGGIMLPKNVVIIGEGMGATTFTYNGDGPLFHYWQDEPGSFEASVGSSHGIEDMTINGGANALSGAIEISDTFGFMLTNVSIRGFTGGFGIALHNRHWWTEGSTFTNVSISNCKKQLVFKRDPLLLGTDSFGYTTFRRVSLKVRDGQTGFIIGDDSVDTRRHSLYNAYLDVNIWHTGNCVGISFGTNGYISDCFGMFRSEVDGTFTGNYITGESETSGFRNFDGMIRTSPLSVAENYRNMVRDLRYVKYRDIGERITGNQVTVQWFKIAKIGTDRSVFTGKVRMTTDYGKASWRTASAEFCFGIRGNVTGGFKPVFTVDGDGFNGSSALFAKFVLMQDLNGDYYLYFRRPKYTNICVFEYSWDRSPEQTFEYFTKVSDPEIDVNLTKVWDSLSYNAQQSYTGDEMVFTGQRAVIASNGGSTVYKVPHALGATPEWYTATAMSADAITTGITSITATSTDIVITFGSTTPAGTGNIVLSAEWARKGFNNRFRPSS